MAKIQLNEINRYFSKVRVYTFLFLNDANKVLLNTLFLGYSRFQTIRE